MNRIHPSEWVPVDGFELEAEAMTSAISDENSLVVAGPGAGKTELLAQRACYLLQTNECKYPKKILAISFKRDAASNLKERVELRCGKELTTRFESKTYDAFAKEILDRFIHSLPNNHQPQKNYDIAEIADIKKAFEISGYQYNKQYGAKIGKVTLPLDSTFTAQMYIDAWRTLLIGNTSAEFGSKLTFEMISRLAEYLIRTNEFIRKSIQMTYSHVFLDEFQDTTTIQYDLVKTCFLGSNSVLTAVGDSKQRIMLWAGAKRTVFEDYTAEFCASRRELIMNHRSAPRLVEIQKALYGSLNEDGSSILANRRWNVEDGLAFLRLFRSQEQEASIIREEICKANQEGIKLNEMCILVKQQVDVYGSGIIDELKTVNIKARNEAVYQDFLKEEIIKILIAVFKNAINEQSPEEWTYLLEIIGEIRGIGVDADAHTVRSFVSYLNNLIIDLKNKLNVVTRDDFIYLVELLMEQISKPLIIAAFPQYSNIKYLDKLVNDFANLLWDEYDGTKDWINTIDNFEGNNSIPIMTIHKSKGLEFDMIFFVGLEDSAFWNFRRQPGEDRCAFFVALSRAKKRIDFTFCAGRETRFTSVQKHEVINEFYQVFKNSGIVEQIDYTSLY